METADRLSRLPDEMLHHILSFIPETKEIARTSVLSKRFRLLWHHHPTIRFDTSIGILNETKPSYSYASSAERYLLSVHRCLLSFRSPTLQTLDLILLSRFPYCNQSATQWVHFAASRSVRCLRLTSTSGYSWTTKIPAAVYSCRTLTSLELHGRIPTCPPDSSFTGFPFLLRLQISGSISSQTLARLLSKCPSLRTLTLYFCTSLDSIDISSKTLSEVSIDSCPELQSVRLDVPNLVSITFLGELDNLRIENARHLLDASVDLSVTSLFTPPGVFADLRHISRRLRVADWLFEFVLPRSPNPNFKNLKELHCRFGRWVDARLLRGLVSVLWHCPNLEQLYVNLALGVGIDTPGCIETEEEYQKELADECQRELAYDQEREVWNPSEAGEGFEDGRLNRLKFVVVECFLGTANEMKMLEFLLSRGSALEKLTIGDCLMRSKEEIHQLLAHIPTASPQLQILQMNISLLQMNISLRK